MREKIFALIGSGAWLEAEKLARDQLLHGDDPFCYCHFASTQFLISSAEYS